MEHLNLVKGAQVMLRCLKSQNRATPFLIVAAFTVLVGLPVHAAVAPSDSERITDLERKLERSQQIIEEMAARILKLETLGARQDASHSSAPPTPSSASTHTAAGAAEPAHAGVPTSVVPGAGLSLLGVPLHGFADVGGVLTRDKRRRKGFTVGSLDFYLTPELGSNVKGLVELVFEVDSEGSLAVDLERLQFGYAFGDYLTAWLGRFHTPLGYWNTAFHHGQQIQTSVRRPQFLDFEDKGGILPVHSVGLWGTGGVVLGDGKLTYDLFVGNAPSIEDAVLTMNMAGATQFRPSYGANIGYAFRGALDGFKAGLHWLRGNVQDVTASNWTALNITGGYFLYTDDPWELISELYRFDNKDLKGKTGTHGSWALAGQLARTFGRWTPYGRGEWTGLNQRDPYFRDMESGRSYTRGAFGIRYDLTAKAALKFEIRRTMTKETTGGRHGETAGETQFSIRF